MNDDRRRAIIREIGLYANDRQLQEDEFTTPQFAKEWGISFGVAYRRLAKLLHEGLVVEIEGGVIDNGKRCRAFRKV
jgi:hypothetical protein